MFENDDKGNKVPGTMRGVKDKIEGSREVVRTTKLRAPYYSIQFL